jgi:hypothetical protein
MTRSRPQYLLADLVAIFALGGFGLALVRSLGRQGDANPAVIFS